MKISTRKTYNTPRSSKATPPSPKVASTGKKTTQKIAKNRLSLRTLVARARKAGKMAGVACIAGLLLFIAVKAYHSEKFRVRSISIYGCQKSQAQRVDQIVRESIPERILDIDLMQLKARLKQDPWIKDVEIRRVLPSGLVIHVDERTPSVIVEMQGQWMVTDDEGILLDRYDPGYVKLDVPIFKGVSGRDIDSYRSSQTENSLRIRHALDMLVEIESGEPEQVRNISEADISEWNNLKIMLMDSTFEIWLGEKDYLKRFRAVLNSPQYEECRDNPNLIKVDVSMGNLIRFVFPENSSTGASPETEGH